MRQLLKIGTIQNGSMRVLCATLLSGAQLVMYGGGCSGTSQGSANTNTNDNGTVGDTGVGTANENSDDAVTSASTPMVDGYWISTRVSDGETLSGLATGAELLSAISISIQEDDGGDWNFSGRWESDRLEGTCLRPLSEDDFDPGDLFGSGDLFEEPPLCQGLFSADGQRLTVSMNDQGVAYDWELRRSDAPSAALIASWNSTQSTVRFITGFDGRILSVFEEGAQQRQYTAVWAAHSGGFAGQDPDGNQWVGLLQDNGATLFSWVSDSGSFVANQSWQRATEPAVFSQPISGRYVSVYNDGDFTNAIRGQASVIFDGTDLYVHQRDDNHRILFVSDYDRGGYWSVVAQYDGSRFASTSGGFFDWSGVVDENGPRLLGYRDGDEHLVLSFDRALAITAAELSGSWSSVSTDYTTSSAPTQTLGQAQISFNGQALTVDDDYAGVRFRIEAQWVGDHFDGQWWAVDEPADKLRWSGEVVGGGAMLHGKWEMGEWSFALGQFAESAAGFESVQAGEFLLVPSPETPVFAVARDSDSDALIQAVHTQGRVSALKILSETGAGALFEVDDRYLAKSLTLQSGERFDFAFSGSLTQLTVVHTASSGATDTQVLAIDVTDAGIETALADYENRTGRSAQFYRDYLAEHGNPWVAGAAPTHIQRTRLGQVHNSVSDRIFKTASGASLIISGIQAVVVGVKLVGTFATAGGALVLAGSIGMFVLGGLLILTALFVVFICVPCTLACFQNCDLPDQPRRACCLPGGGGCSITTRDACDGIGGSYVQEATTCDNVVCGSADASVPGPCCLPNGSCVVLPEDDCQNSSGSFVSNPSVTGCSSVICGSSE